MHVPNLGQLPILEPHNSDWCQLHLLNGKLGDRLVLDWKIVDSLPLGIEKVILHFALCLLILKRVEIIIIYLFFNFLK